MTLDFYQIYFKDEQLPELYPFAKPHLNTRLTPYFENSVIAELVPQATADYVAVCSWALRRKRKNGMPEVLLNQKYGSTDLTEAHIMECDADVIKLTPTGHYDIRRKLMQWHIGSGEKALAVFDRFFKIPDEVRHAIYENHFISRREIYQEYVETCLKPAIEFMEGEPVFSLPSGYKAKKARISGQQDVDSTLMKLGMDDWPIGVFVLERLFCSWIEKRKYNVTFV